MRTFTWLAGGVLAGLAVAGVVLGSGVSPAFAADGAEVPPSSADPSPPSIEARAAALVVEAYVSDVPLAAIPAADAPKREWSESAIARTAFYEGFPVEAGVTQWGCQLLDDDLEVAFTPETSEKSATYGYSFGLRCDGYWPTNEEIFSPRPDAISHR